MFLWSLVLGLWSLLEQSRDFPAGQGEDVDFFRGVIERTKGADLLEPAHGVEGVEKLGVTRRQFGRLQVTVAQVG